MLKHTQKKVFIALNLLSREIVKVQFKDANIFLELSEYRYMET